MNSTHYDYNTPQGLAALNAIDARLRARLRTKADPTLRVAAWYAYRQERYVELGLEALTGPSATYHLEDVARHICDAAETLSGYDAHGSLRPTRKHPSAALDALAKGFGFRYLRAVRGLHDALIEARVSTDDLACFDRERQEFNDAFLPQLDAAAIVNSRGQNPQAVVDAIQMFAQELDRACEWLDITRQGARSKYIREVIDAAMIGLHGTPEDTPRLRHRKAGRMPYERTDPE